MRGSWSGLAKDQHPVSIRVCSCLRVVWRHLGYGDVAPLLGTSWFGVICGIGLRVDRGLCRAVAEWVIEPEALVPLRCAEGEESLYC